MAHVFPPPATRMSPDEIPLIHLEAGEVAAYLDRAVSPAERDRIELHLADCAACRAEVHDVARLLRTAPVARRRYVRVGLAAAAILALLTVPRLYRPAPPGDVAQREPAVTSTVAPTAVAPRGSTTGVPALVWTGVPGADRYRVKLIDATGSAFWQQETSDTSVAVPDSVRLLRGALYFWRVDAHIGWERWAASELQDFRVGRDQP